MSHPATFATGAAVAVLFLACLYPAPGAADQPLIVAPQALAVARQEHRLDLRLRVVRTVEGVEVMQEVVRPVFRDLRASEGEPWTQSTSLGDNVTLSLDPRRQFDSPFFFHVEARTRVKDDGSVLLSAELRQRGGLPTWSRWRYVNRYQKATVPEQRLVPGGPFVRIAEVKDWTSDEARAQALRGEAPPSNPGVGGGYTAYYLEAAVEVIPATLTTEDWLRRFYRK